MAISAHFTRSLLCKAVLAASLFGLAGCVTDGGNDLESRSIAVTAGDGVASPAGASNAFSALVQRTGPSYVTLNVSEVTGGSDTGGRGKDSLKRGVTSGSGFVVDGNGYVMTAAHVAVKTGNSVTARASNGKSYSGAVVAILPENDMALIKLKSFSGKPVTPAGSSCMSRGSGVFSLGKPEEQGDTARIGRLEAMRFGKPASYGKFGYPDAMVIKMDTHRGESGGPLFNENGELAGMVVSTLADGNGRPLSLSHALPLWQIAPFLCANLSCSSRWQQLAAAGSACSS